MTTWTRVGYLAHDLSFGMEAPSGFARCRRCDASVTMEQGNESSCPGAPPEAVRPPMPAGAVPCALCGTPVAVASRNRDVVECHGTTCSACFGMGEAHP